MLGLSVLVESKAMHMDTTILLVLCSFWHSTGPIHDGVRSAAEHEQLISKHASFHNIRPIRTNGVECDWSHRLPGTTSQMPVSGGQTQMADPTKGLFAKLDKH